MPLLALLVPLLGNMSDGKKRHPLQFDTPSPALRVFLCVCVCHATMETNQVDALPASVLFTLESLTSLMDGFVSDYSGHICSLQSVTEMPSRFSFSIHTISWHSDDDSHFCISEDEKGFIL